MIILASQSPRRKELMEKYISTSFLVIPSHIDEEINNNISPLENVINIAKAKGMDIAKDYKEDIVISCDTVVILNNKIYGKPENKIEAFNMLKELSNKTHEVISAYWIFYKDISISKYVSSKVTFNNLSDELINQYVDTLSPLDKAGGYGIQDPLGNQLVKEYKGSLNNIIGFPVEEIKKDLEGLKNI